MTRQNRSQETAGDSTLLFAGDTHGALGHLDAVPDGCTVIHLGDFELAEPLERALPPQLHDRFWWIPGNHDFDSVSHYDHLLGSALAQRNLHARVVPIAGVRVAGLGGVFRASVWYPPEEPVATTPKAYLRHVSSRQRWRGGLSLKLRKAIWHDDYQALRSQRADVLVLHEAPETLARGFAALGDLARAMDVHTVVHGHHHVDYVTEIPPGIRVVGVGLRSVADVTGRIVVAGLPGRAARVRPAGDHS